MDAVAAKVLERVVIQLNALKAEYKIILPDGSEHGTLEVKRKKKATSGNRSEKWAKEGRKYGELTAHIKPRIMNMAVGDVVSIPFDRFKKEAVSGAVSSIACHLWGNGSATIATTDSAVEIMRLQ